MANFRGELPTDPRPRPSVYTIVGQLINRPTRTHIRSGQKAQAVIITGCATNLVAIPQCPGLARTRLLMNVPGRAAERERTRVLCINSCYSYLQAQEIAQFSRCFHPEIFPNFPFCISFFGSFVLQSTGCRIHASVRTTSASFGIQWKLILIDFRWAVDWGGW